MGTVLVAEDHKPLRKLVAKALERERHTVLEAADGREAIETVAENDVDVVVSDIRMPRMNGMELLSEIHRRFPSVQVILITAYGDVPQAVEAMKQGAYDFLEKESEGRLNIAQLRARVAKAAEKRRLILENAQLKKRLNERFAFENIVARSLQMQRVLETVRQVAPTRASVLITGESGTGKEVIANAIHTNSTRKSGPFIKVNCGAIPETLLESELFGHEKGAFTGAHRSRIGRFEAADEGTLFLDEIATLSPAMQVKLLRVLQDGRFERVGGSRTIEVDVRLISATNAELRQEVKEGRFREDLFWRINVVHIHVAPLRERREDIPELVHTFLVERAARNDKKIDGVDEEAMAALLRYDFPGNVRELENIIESAVVFCRGDTITVDLLPEEVRSAAEPVDRLVVPVGVTLDEAERRLIEATLRHTGGNKTQAARVLGIGKRTLFRKLKEYGLSSSKGDAKLEDETHARRVRHPDSRETEHLS